MKRRKSGGAYRREKIILTASSVLVLTAMTVTGVYIYNSNQPAEPEDNVVDFSALENSVPEKNEEVAQAQNSSAQNLTSGQDNSGELDYDPYYAEQERLMNEDNAGSGMEAEAVFPNADADGMPQESADIAENNVGYAEINADRQNNAERQAGELAEGELDAAAGGIDGLLQENGGGTDALNGNDGTAEEESGGESQSDAENAGSGENGDAAGAENGGEVLREAVADVMQEEVSLHFSEDAKLQWPIVGNVLLNYSMDKTIYFPTLQQYKYNPSIVISATQGTSIACAADGVVKSIYKDSQTGMTVVMNLGDGYELSYGQLQDVMVEEGDFVEAGAFIAKVAAPTKYYTVEGTNVYFKLTKDGEPVNPMNYMG